MLIIDKRYAMMVIALIVLLTAVSIVVAATYKENKINDDKPHMVESRFITVNASSNVFQHKQYIGHVNAKQRNSTVDLETSNQLEGASTNTNHTDEAVTVSVWLSEQKKVEQVPLEEYVLAVTMHEMPWSFQDEAIKAQMIAARTYILYRIKNIEHENNEYDVTDSTMHQVYRSIDEHHLSAAEEEALARFRSLLDSTKGEVITYKDQLIDALYFSTSNGKTESAEHYFNHELPYLKSVTSSWDKDISPSYSKQFEFTFEQFYSKLQASKLLDKAYKLPTIEVLERSKSNRIVLLNVNNVKIGARQFREALALASTDFTWTIDKENKKITFITTGYGHGVGMSQWGAEGMAREGYKAVDILQHYYTDIKVESL